VALIYFGGFGGGVGSIVGFEGETEAVMDGDFFGVLDGERDSDTVDVGDSDIVLVVVIEGVAERDILSVGVIDGDSLIVGVVVSEMVGVTDIHAVAVRL